MTNRLLDLVDERENELKQILADLIGFPTVSPPARNTNEIQAYIANFLKQQGFATDSWEVFPNDPNLVAIKKGKDNGNYNSLIINGHIDVAEVGDDTNWSVPVFELTEKSGYLYGRGVADMKGAVAATLLAVKILNEQGILLNGDLQIQTVIGEEAGEAGTLSCIEKGYSGDFALVVDSSDRQIQGQGGVITGWITVKSKKVYHDAMRAELNQSASSHYGVSAIEKMMKIIASLRDLENHWSETKSYPGFKKGTNTINPAVIEGGRHAAFVADECRLWITVHFYPNESYQSVIAEIETHLANTISDDPWFDDNPLSFRWGGKSMIEDRGEIFPSAEVDKTHPAITLLQKSHEQTAKGIAEIGMSKSVTDAGWFYEAGIPAAIYGPGKLEEAHSVDEKIELEELVSFTKTLLTFIPAWCNKLKLDTDNKPNE
ncbi:acetylornithine deacetylase [Gracilibacillus oryzae]|uniref:Acetylornithine deacetylase n=1 Tax=Gracilibacillus oryzae TaxID=1672701 RepID=A0A7C8KPX7_9BACI|nr:acetylornithine deacetylase [Gracilibacillus oryzae]KAB8126285.1 acetylornithine deacetylase [Gracilibacillus oryzae]